MNLKINGKHRHKLITMGYAFAITIAFILSLTNNNDVSASVSENERLSYLMIETNVADNMEDPNSIYPASSIENIRGLFQMVSDFEREKDGVKEVEVQKGDTLISILSDLGFTRDQANDAYAELRKVWDPRDLKAGQKLTLHAKIDSNTQEMIRFEALVIEPQVGVRHIIKQDKNQQFSIVSEKDELITEVNNAKGAISGTLSHSMQNQGVPRKVISQFINIFSYSVDFRRDVRKGDQFEIIYENQITPDGKMVSSGNILYAALKLRNDKIALYRFEDDKGQVDYFTEKGQAMKKTLHRKPMSFQAARISSPFGKRRHPIYKDVRIHWGVDYAAPKGTLIYAAGDGVVQVAKYNGGYGNYIKIRHNSEYSTAYGHMNGYAKGIRPGVRVKQGQVIGYVGSTGRSTGPHLHYEVIKNGRRVNPTTIKAATGENLSGKKMAKFKKQVAELKTAYASMFAEDKDHKLAKK